MWPKLDKPVAISCRTQAALVRAHLAALHAGRSSLLLTGPHEALLREIAARYPGLCIYTDEPKHPQFHGLTTTVVDELPHLEGLPADLADGMIVTVLFTSGSTGDPKPIPKTWGSLTREARAAAAAFGMHLDDSVRVFTTAPIEHMFAYMFGFFMPRLHGVRVADRRPVFPADLVAQTERSPLPAWVITTPTHLRAYVEARVRLSNVRRVVSATSPLSAELAGAAATCFGVAISEIYGSTETGAVASRVWGDEEPPWECLPGLRMENVADGVRVSGAHLREPVVLGDLLELNSPTTFRFVARNADLIKVAGKRTSLSALNAILLQAPGIRDGAYYFPEKSAAEATGRPVAFVVLQPGASCEGVTAYLRTRMDEVFLPRPLYEVEALQRAVTGKLPHAALRKLYESVASLRQANAGRHHDGR